MQGKILQSAKAQHEERWMDSRGGELTIWYVVQTRE